MVKNIDLLFCTVIFIEILILFVFLVLFFKQSSYI